MTVKLVAGVGYNDFKYKSSGTKEHSLWRSMLARCYNESNLLKKPAYLGCTVSENFKNYSYFYEWCNEQIGFGNKGWCLDKDLLIKGNKIYSEDNCVFVPMIVNNIIVKADSIRGEFPIGVVYDKDRNKFQSKFWSNNKPVHLGRFDTPEEAFYAYKKAKESYIKSVALKWKDQIDPRAYDALMNYQVDITD